MLKIFDPITLAIAKSVFFLMAAITEVAVPQHGLYVVKVAGLRHLADYLIVEVRGKSRGAKKIWLFFVFVPNLHHLCKGDRYQQFNTTYINTKSL